MKAISLFKTIGAASQQGELHWAWNVFTKDKITEDFVRKILLDYLIYIEEGNLRTDIDTDNPIYLTKVSAFRNYNLFKVLGIKKQKLCYSKNFFYEKLIPEVKRQWKLLGFLPTGFYPIIYHRRPSIKDSVRLGAKLFVTSELKETHTKKPSMQFLTHKHKVIRDITKCLENSSL